jgi:hypothetical protein
MLESRSDPDLPLETFRSKAGGELGVQHLERDRAVVPEIVGEKHRGHAPAAELALDAVVVGQGGLKSVDSGIGQLEVLPELL